MNCCSCHIELHCNHLHPVAASQSNHVNANTDPVWRQNESVSQASLQYWYSRTTAFCHFKNLISRFLDECFGATHRAGKLERGSWKMRWHIIDFFLSLLTSRKEKWNSNLSSDLSNVFRSIAAALVFPVRLITVGDRGSTVMIRFISGHNQRWAAGAPRRPVASAVL